MAGALDQLRVVEAQFDELADRLSALLELHAGDEAASFRLRAALAAARRGAKLTRAQMLSLSESD